jgi:hypothetical protein
MWQIQHNGEIQHQRPFLNFIGPLEHLIPRMIMSYLQDNIFSDSWLSPSTLSHKSTAQLRADFAERDSQLPENCTETRNAVLKPAHR